jgi:hypothetical protein
MYVQGMRNQIREILRIRNQIRNILRIRNQIRNTARIGTNKKHPQDEEPNKRHTRNEETNKRHTEDEEPNKKLQTLKKHYEEKIDTIEKDTAETVTTKKTCKVLIRKKIRQCNV